MEKNEQAPYILRVLRASVLIMRGRHLTTETRGARRNTRLRMVRSGFFIAVPIILVVAVTLLQLPASGQSSNGRGVVRLRVKSKLGGETKSLARKRFFLVKGNLEQNKLLIETIEKTPALGRSCYYRGIGASEALIDWLKNNDCESIYCRELEAKDVEGDAAVPEFKLAYAKGEKEFGNQNLARAWITVNLPEDIRSGFYRKQQAVIQALLKQAEESSKAKVISVMTDRNGTAYFTELEPGAYVVTNLVPTEFGGNSLLWTCEINVKPGDLATERPFTLSNQKDRQVKCVAVEKPLPACPSAPRASQ